MKLALALIISLSYLISFTNAGERQSFDKDRDLFIAQFDNMPDSDDIHSQAALGSMMSRSKYSDVKMVAVHGTYGTQFSKGKGKWKFIDSASLFDMAFGLKDEKWVDAHRERPKAVQFLMNKAKATLTAGGKVWVMEAGQSNVTADWVAALIEAGIKNTKTHVIVVQHSRWNEGATSKDKLAYTKANTNFVTIDDGNAEAGDYSKRAKRGDLTPKLLSTSKDFIKSATGEENKNVFTRSLWEEAKKITDACSYKSGPIPKGGVDFSDVVEALWIFESTKRITSVDVFWDTYVLAE